MSPRVVTRIVVSVTVAVGVLYALPSPGQAAIAVSAGDVFAVVPDGGSGRTEVHALSRVDAYHSFSLHVATGLNATNLSNWAFGIGDYDRDGIPDFWAIDSRDNGGRNTAAHVFSGASNFQTAILHKRLPSMGATDLSVWQFFVADYNGDGRADLYAVNSRDSGGSNTAAHVFDAASSLGSFLLHKQLPQMGSANLDVWQFTAGDYNGDGRADLYAIDTRDNGGSNTAAHVFNAANGFGSFLIQKRLPGMGSASLSRWQFTVGDHNTDGRADLVAVDSQDSGTDSTAIHALNAADGFGSYLVHSGSALHRTNLDSWQFHGWPGAASGGGWALPLPRSAAPRSEYDDPHHDYPAIDIGVPTGTPAYALRSGTATRVNSSSCGLGISLAGADGATYNYCHFSAWSVSSGTVVGAGRQIGLTGNTGNSTGPHLHLQIRSGGLLRCPQSMLLAIYDGRTPPPASSLPTGGCSF